MKIFSVTDYCGSDPIIFSNYNNATLFVISELMKDAIHQIEMDTTKHLTGIDKLTALSQNVIDIVTDGFVSDCYSIEEFVFDPPVT